MVLVSYADSEGSEDEKPQPQAKKEAHLTVPKPDTKFTVDKSNPRKIRVTLQEIKDDPTADGRPDGEPAPKRAKVGGSFSGFNSMLPTPKRETPSTHGTKDVSKSTTKKVFSLKTGSEPGFSRDSDAELRELFAEQGTDLKDKGLDDKNGVPEETAGIGKDLTSPPGSQSAPPMQKQGDYKLFKPLSVARNTQKKRSQAKVSVAAQGPQALAHNSTLAPETSAPAPKVNLFSFGNTDAHSHAPGAQQLDYEPLFYQDTAAGDSPAPAANGDEGRPADSTVPTPSASAEGQTQSLDSIAADLNLSASAKRQLLGRNHRDASKISSSVINFNTDREYAANEALRASGEMAQHNPVRAIAPGKHSLKQLVNAASGQKEALEESFASGRRNKKEAGSRYGW